MDDKSLQVDVEVAEELDQQLQDESSRIEDIHGSLEAVTQAIVADGEPVELTEHQKKRVDDFYAAAKAHKAQVYAVVDKAALETYIDSEGIERSFKPMPGELPLGETLHGLRKDHGAHVWGTFTYGGLLLPGNEGFFEMTSGLAKKAALAFSEEIPSHFRTTAKGLNHYVEMAQRLRTRLVQLRPLMLKRDQPYCDIFDYGAYSRFFQSQGQAVDGFAGFHDAMKVQYVATMHSLAATQSYGIPVMEKMLASLQALRVDVKPDSEVFVALRDSIQNHWGYTWKDADITPKHGQTPQAALNAFPERKFVSLAPLLDNRYLVAHEPKSNGGNDPAKITTNIKHYGASVVFEKKAGPVTHTSMVLPDMDTLLELVDQTINGLQELKALEVLAKKNEGFAKDFKKATDILNKAVQSTQDKEFFGFIAEYFKLATAVNTTIQQPYIQMAWMYVRCAMVVVSLAELAVLEEPKQRVVYARLGAKQNTEFSNPALESYAQTVKALAVARSRN